MSRSSHDFEVIMPFPSPIVDARVTEVVKGEVFDIRFFTDPFMRPSNMI